MLPKKNKSTSMLYLSFFLALTNIHAFTLTTYRQQQFNTNHISFINRSNDKTTILRMSSVGDGKGNNNNNNGSSGSSDNNLDDWLDPRKASSESDNLKRAREKISEESLPINFDISQEEEEEEDDVNGDQGEDLSLDIEEEKEEEEKEDEKVEGENNEIAIQNTVQNLMEEKEELTGKLDLLRGGNSNNNSNKTITTAGLMSSNPYLQVVSKLSPSDLISKFTSTAHPRVQDAVRSTVLGLIGTLPKMAFETTTITTGERLASLMFQLQLTGYMLKNADYRLSLSQSLGMTVSTSKNGQNSQYLLEGDLDDYDDEELSLSEGKVRGKIKITYGKKKSAGKEGGEVDKKKDSQEEKEEDEEEEDISIPSMEVEVDAAAYMAELRNEVAKLREDLVTTRKEKEDEIRKDLLLYIRTLPQKELKSLTGTLSDDVLNAMKGLVNVVMAGIGEGQIGPDTITEQSGEAMAQLCMWQLVVGYNLRELEVREEMKNALKSGSLDFSESKKGDGSDSDSGTEKEGSIDFDKGGFE